MLLLDYNLKFKKNDNYMVEDLGDDCTMVYDQTNANTFLLDELMTFIYNVCVNNNITNIIDKVMNCFDVSEVDKREVEIDCEEAIIQLINEKIVLYA